MNKNILNTGVQNFILKNIASDIPSLLLKKPVFDTISPKELVEQIESKKHCKKKLPTWFKTTHIYYPKKLNIEQTSSEEAARYKAEIVSGKSLIDLTGGFGVDSYFFSQKMKTVFYCEIDVDLTEITAHNFEVLGAKNIKITQGNGIRFLSDSAKQFDWLYIDPSRRNNKKEKVFNLSDCMPDITQHLDLFFASTTNVLIKTAPFLDISAGKKDLKHIKQLHILAVKGEVKELLWVLKRDYSGEIQIKTTNLLGNSRQTFDFFLREEKQYTSSFSPPLEYLYEPNSAILKSGAFKTVGNRFSIAKIHRHTHLYTSSDLIKFPGRRFIIRQCAPYDRKIGSFLKGMKANVSARNFPKTVDEIKKQFKIKDGGSNYLFFVRNSDERLIVLHCEKLI